MTRVLPALLLLLLVLPAAGGCGPRGAVSPRADLVFVNGAVYTLDPRRPRVQAVAVREGRIFATGTDGEVSALAGEKTRVVNLKGATVVPGFVDSHGHTFGLGEVTKQVNLRRARTVEQVVTSLRTRLRKTKPGEWILGWGLSPALATSENARRISEATPANPVWIRLLDWHGGVANRAAMARAKIAGRTGDPPGGATVRDGRGEATGLFIDAAVERIEAHLPPFSLDELKAQILRAQRILLRQGLTGVHDAGRGYAIIAGLVKDGKEMEKGLAAFKALAEEGKLKIRFNLMVTGTPEWLRSYVSRTPIRIGTSRDRLTVRCVKLMMDGSLLTRGAWLLEPYEASSPGGRDSDERGIVVTAPGVVEAVAATALKHRWQVAIHAIGDRAVREALDIFEALLPSSRGASPRFRIEHALMVSGRDIPRFAKLGVIASMQPLHMMQRAEIPQERIGKTRLEELQPWRKLLDSGARLAAGSDFPVVSPNPLFEFYSAVTRRGVGGRTRVRMRGEAPEKRLVRSGGQRRSGARNVLHAERRAESTPTKDGREAMTREEALRALTVEGCYASFDEAAKGTLEPGKCADMVILDRDIMTVAPSEILRARVKTTVIEGELFEF